MDDMNSHGEWIADPTRLANWPQAGDAGQRPLAMDTEFVRERTYFPQLGLVQIACEGEIGLVDPLPAGCAAAIAELLRRHPLVLMHSASEDLEALQRATGQMPRALFDTQIGAALAGFGAGISYQKLIEATLGIKLDKSETRTDWLRRPLSPAQLSYAADDVRHLEAAAERIRERLMQLGRLEWALADSARVLQAGARAEPDPEPHLAIRSAERLDAAGQALLRRVLRWREAEARRLDRPRGWILENGLALRLAERRPADRESLDHLLEAWPKAPRKHRDALWEALDRPLSEEERVIPLAEPDDRVDRERLRRLQDAVIGVARALDLPESVLASRRPLVALLKSGEWPAALDNWRRPLLEPVLLPLVG